MASIRRTHTAKQANEPEAGNGVHDNPPHSRAAAACRWPTAALPAAPPPAQPRGTRPTGAR